MPASKYIKNKTACENKFIQIIQYTTIKYYSGAGTAFSSQHPSSPPFSSWIRVARSLVFY